MEKSNSLRLWSSWTANSDKKYMEFTGAVLIVDKPCATYFGKVRAGIPGVGRVYYDHRDNKNNS